MAWGPWAVPGLVMALGFLWAFVWLPIYGTLWLLVLVFVARGLPVGVMLTGRLYDEASLLAMALGYEKARGPLAQRPRLQTTD